MAARFKVTDWSRGPKDDLFPESTVILLLLQGTSVGKRGENKICHSPKVRHIQTLMHNSIYPGKCCNWVWNLKWARQFIRTFPSIRVVSGLNTFYWLMTLWSIHECQCIEIVAAVFCPFLKMQTILVALVPVHVCAYTFRHIKAAGRSCCSCINVFLVI